MEDFKRLIKLDINNIPVIKYKNTNPKPLILSSKCRNNKYAVGKINAENVTGSPK